MPWGSSGTGAFYTDMDQNFPGKQLNLQIPASSCQAFRINPHGGVQAPLFLPAPQVILMYTPEHKTFLSTATPSDREIA